MGNRDVYITTVSGRKFYYLDPVASDIVIEDIAHSLARLARYNGHTNGSLGYSVAQHCVHAAQLVSRYVDDYMRVQRKTTIPGTPELTRAQIVLATLLHDAPEYVTGDIVGPFKKLLAPSFEPIVKPIEAVIEKHFGLPVGSFEHPIITGIDKRMRRNETLGLCYHGDSGLCSAAMGEGTDNSMPNFFVTTNNWSPIQANRIFLLAFDHYSRAVALEQSAV